MIETSNKLAALGRLAEGGQSAGAGGLGGTAAQSGTSFAEVLQKGIDEVAKLQAEASAAAEALATGQSQDVVGVMTAMNKASLAFKTLLAIRGKLMDAYDEIRNMQV